MRVGFLFRDCICGFGVRCAGFGYVVGGEIRVGVFGCGVCVVVCSLVSCFGHGKDYQQDEDPDQACGDVVDYAPALVDCY